MKLPWLIAASCVFAAPTRDEHGATPDHPIRLESRLWITGASNIRRFTCKARQLSGSVELRGVATRAPFLLGENMSAQPSLLVSVDRVDCGIGAMNRHLRDALNSAQHPVIEFRITTYEVDVTLPTPVARIAGQLTIAGVQRPVTLTAAVRADTLGVVRVQGSYLLHPTEFGVTPPRRFGGLIKVRDRIVVHFDIAVDTDVGAIEPLIAR